MTGNGGRTNGDGWKEASVPFEYPLDEQTADEFAAFERGKRDGASAFARDFVGFILKSRTPRSRLLRVECMRLFYEQDFSAKAIEQTAKRLGVTFRRIEQGLAELKSFISDFTV
jgi:hypothetical protein